jgi:hypothetical protein
VASRDLTRQREWRRQQLGGTHEQTGARTMDRVYGKEQPAQCRWLPSLSTDTAAVGHEDDHSAYTRVQREVDCVVAERRQLVNVEVQLQRGHRDGPPRRVGAWVVERCAPEIMCDERRPGARGA